MSVCVLCLWVYQEMCNEAGDHDYLLVTTWPAYGQGQGEGSRSASRHEINCVPMDRELDVDSATARIGGHGSGQSWQLHMSDEGTTGDTV